MGSFRWAAVSSSPAVYGMQRMFSTLAEMSGCTAAVFMFHSQARRWLLGGAAPGETDSSEPA